MNVASETKALPLYPLSEPVLEIALRERGQTYTYRLRRPTLTDEVETERLGQTIKVTHPKNKAGDQPIEIRTDHTRANIAYAKRLVQDVAGFQVFEHQDPNLFVSADTLLGDGRKVVDALPAHHLNYLANRVFGGEIRVVEPPEGGKIIRALGGQQLIELEWLIRDFDGSADDDDDDVSGEKPLKHRVVFSFNDPSPQAQRKWETTAFNKSNIIGKDGKVTETSFYNLPAIYALARMCLVQVRGASVQGREIDLLHHSEDWAFIPERLQKSLVAIFFNYVTNELGN